MKKDYGDGKTRLFKGTGYIRKGTHQTRLTRDDYDRFYKIKLDENDFNDDISIYLVGSGKENEISLKSKDGLKRPSQIKKNKIECILEAKRREKEKFNPLLIPDFDPDNFKNSFAYMSATLKGTALPYENRDISTLENNLKNVEETYRKHDFYELFERQSDKCNFIIFNNGHKYIENLFVRIKIPTIHGLFISKTIYSNPDSSIIMGDIAIYPNVKEDGNFYIIEDDIGDIKHQIKQEIFKVPF